jgi:acyl-CoA synthetase (AMP-forming)/AMP-acid ligase II
MTLEISGSAADLETVVDLLQWRSQSDQVAYIFLKNGELEPTELTYRGLMQRVWAIVPKLAGYERLLLVYGYESGLEFIVAFYACLVAGVVAVPCHPPRNRQDFVDLQARLDGAQAQGVLTERSLLNKLSANLTADHWWVTDDGSVGEPGVVPIVEPDNLAFLQFTSGSTGVPKGVMVTHRCIRRNQQMLEVAFGSNAQTISVGWLPLFHDMGLIGNVLQPLHLGIPSILMSPMAFVQKPLRWLQAMSHYKATTSGAPNFAYDLLCRQVSNTQKQELDLSHWELAFTGAEAIRPATLAQFSEAFAACGFRREAFYPCYGMAEATLFITGGTKTEWPRVVELPRVGDESARSLVSCGKPWLDTQIVIVNPETLAACDENQVGEIWVAGSGVAIGYWNMPEESDRTFGGRLGDRSEKFLRTGDLGFLNQQELFITGRLKELLVFWGFNHYPQHIEQTVETCHPALRSNAGAAFSVRVEDEEKLVIAHEVERHYRHCLDVKAVVEAIRWAVFDQHFVDVYAIVFLKPGGIPKTSSGKIQRRACQQQFLAGELSSIAEWRSPTTGDMTTVLNRYLNPATHAQRYGALIRGKIRRWLYSVLGQ